MIPFGWNGKKMIDAFSGQVPMLQQGSRGFSYPGPEGRPVAYFVFDTQGENSIRMIERLKPLLNDIDIHFYPVAYLNWRSGPQGAQILGAAEPWRALDHHIVRFSDPGTRGLRVSRTGDRPAMESAVWANGKVTARSEGATSLLASLRAARTAMCRLMGRSRRKTSGRCSGRARAPTTRR